MDLPAKKTICLTMIVKNESKIITTMLDSVVKFIDCWVIVDTGSTDGTQQVVKDYFITHKIPGELHERPWVNFGHNRSEAMALADGKADYLWVMDADDSIVGTPDFSNLTFDSYTMKIGEEFSHWRHQLFKSGLGWVYKGVLHEFAHSDQAKNSARLLGDYRIVGRCAGARNSDPQKYQKDAILLEEAVKSEPDNGRYWFYLGQSYFDYQNWKESKRCYEKRVSMGGWQEECFYAQWRVAQCAIQLKEPSAQIMAAFTKAFEIRPQRAEALHGLAQYCRDIGKNALGYLYAKVASQIPYPINDSLFIFKNIYDFHALDELAVNGYWIGNFGEATNINTQLLSKGLVPPDQIPRVCNNLRASASNAGMKCPPDELHVLRPGAIGDILMTLWAVEAYKRKNPKHKIFYYCAKQYLDIPMMSKAVTKAIDTVYYPHYSKVMMGYPLGEGYPNKQMTKHLIEYFGKELGVDPLEAKVKWELKTKKVDFGSPYITVQSKVGWSPYKEWPIGRWNELIGRIKAKYPKYAIVQVKDPNEPALENVTKQEGTIAEAISMVARARLHIGGDSFPNHVRGIVDRPALILWGSTSPIGSGYDCCTNIWHKEAYPCSPCYREYPNMSRHPKPACPKCKGWKDVTHPCMHTISVDEVWVAVDKELGG